ncbi:MAG: phosphoribosylanthranilate isomerase [Luteolibacter sp.]
MSPIASFLDPAVTSLKVCGVTTAQDAEQLFALGTQALGVNFWPHSKRYLDPREAGWLRNLKGPILRVGVFVNERPELALKLLEDGWIDIIQLHGDESVADAEPYRRASVPFIKALGVAARADLQHAADFGASAVLLDTHAPGQYGGTGTVFDWNAAVDFKRQHSQIPLMLAGGITPENMAEAIAKVRPAVIDVASGAESSPGIKDFSKVKAMLDIIKQSNT